MSNYYIMNITAIATMTFEELQESHLRLEQQNAELVQQNETKLCGGVAALPPGARARTLGGRALPPDHGQLDDLRSRQMACLPL